MATKTKKAKQKKEALVSTPNMDVIEANVDFDKIEVEVFETSTEDVDYEELEAQILNEMEQLEEIPITKDLIEAGRRIAEKTCVLEIHIRRPGFTKRIKSDHFLDVSGNNGEVASEVLKVSQDIIERKEIRDLELQRKQFIRYLKGLAIPGGMLTLGGGQYLILLSRLSELRDEISNFVVRRELLLNEFAEKYPTIIESSKIKRGAFFDAMDYPDFSVIRSRYSLDYRFISNTVPEELKKVSEELYEAEKQKVIMDCAVTAREARNALRQMFVELVKRVKEKLGPDPETGKQMTISGARVDKLINFINDFGKLDLTNDSALAAKIEDAQAILSGVDVDDIRDDEELQNVLKESFETVLEEAQSLVVPMGRALDLD